MGTALFSRAKTPKRLNMQTLAVPAPAFRRAIRLAWFEQLFLTKVVSARSCEQVRVSVEAAVKQVHLLQDWTASLTWMDFILGTEDRPEQTSTLVLPVLRRVMREAESKQLVPVAPVQVVVVLETTRQVPPCSPLPLPKLPPPCSPDPLRAWDVPIRQAKRIRAVMLFILIVGWTGTDLGSPMFWLYTLFLVRVQVMAINFKSFSLLKCTYW